MDGSRGAAIVLLALLALAGAAVAHGAAGDPAREIRYATAQLDEAAAARVGLVAVPAGESEEYGPMAWAHRPSKDARAVALALPLRAGGAAVRLEIPPVETIGPETDLWSFSAAGERAFPNATAAALGYAFGPRRGGDVAFSKGPIEGSWRAGAGRLVVRAEAPAPLGREAPRELAALLEGAGVPEEDRAQARVVRSPGIARLAPAADPLTFAWEEVFLDALATLAREGVLRGLPSDVDGAARAAGESDSAGFACCVEATAEGFAFVPRVVVDATDLSRHVDVPQPPRATGSPGALSVLALAAAACARPLLRSI